MGHDLVNENVARIDAATKDFEKLPEAVSK
jgi:hypothetical protein